MRVLDERIGAEFHRDRNQRQSVLTTKYAGRWEAKTKSRGEHPNSMTTIQKWGGKSDGPSYTGMMREGMDAEQSSVIHATPSRNVDNASMISIQLDLSRSSPYLVGEKRRKVPRRTATAIWDAQTQKYYVHCTMAELIASGGFKIFAPQTASSSHNATTHRTGECRSENCIEQCTPADRGIRTVTE